jgi:succinate dehydrogenase / fumarate reductase cytochrome b subunit
MANIFASSIGKKLVMSLSGLFLMVFLALHAGINLLILSGAEAYNAACHFMDTNPFIQIMVPVLALGFFIHIIYALYLTWNNWKSRGTQAYAVGNKSKASSWAARNMFVLGLIIVGFLILHLTHFWAKMQLARYLTGEGAADPYSLVVERFSQPLYSIIYMLWFCALWFHLTHGFWSAFQTLGLNNNKWLRRWKTLSYIYATLVVMAFLSAPIYVIMNNV